MKIMIQIVWFLFCVKSSLSVGSTVVGSGDWLVWIQFPSQSSTHRLEMIIIFFLESDYKTGPTFIYAFPVYLLRIVRIKTNFPTNFSGVRVTRSSGCKFLSYIIFCVEEVVMQKLYPKIQTNKYSPEDMSLIIRWNVKKAQNIHKILWGFSLLTNLHQDNTETMSQLLFKHIRIRVWQKKWFHVSFVVILFLRISISVSGTNKRSSAPPTARTFQKSTSAIVNLAGGSLGYSPSIQRNTNSQDFFGIQPRFWHFCQKLFTILLRLLHFIKSWSRSEQNSPIDFK